MNDVDTTKLPKTRGEAKKLKAKHYFTGVPCINGHVYHRNTITGACLVCARARCKSFHSKNKEYFEKYKESGKRKAVQTKYRANNKEKIKAISGAYIERNKEIIRLKGAVWAKNNRGKRCLVTNQYRKRFKLATPKWLSVAQRRFIKGLYREASELTKTTGISHAVDHIVPLKNAIVCGLNVPWNLRVIPESENCRKFTKLLDFPPAFTYP